MLERGVVVSHETIRRWCNKFGEAYANQLRRRRARPGDKWHLDKAKRQDGQAVLAETARAAGVGFRGCWSPTNSVATGSRIASRCRRRRFKSAGHAQRFMAVFGVIGLHLRPRRHRLSADEYRG